MFLEERVKLFVGLGKILSKLSKEQRTELALSARNQNSWFTEESVDFALQGIQSFLEQSSLEKWVSSYDLSHTRAKRVGVIAAGNIPLVGFHDMLSVLIAGHHLLIKPSSQDTFLVTYIIAELVKLDPRVDAYISVVERLNDAEAYIATGSDNTARYFKHYFKDKPNVIRANRTSLAVITGKETQTELEALGEDVFRYYGLGCRNVSKILVPKGYELPQLLDAFAGYAAVGDHHKYRNNYDYNKSIYLVNREPHLDNEFLLVRESEELVSPISVLYYQYYESHAELERYLQAHESKIQCVVGQEYIPFGQAQLPSLEDYADGVDTMAFLSRLE
ncbi:Acyl-CoA reductase (LuxC) [Reichenbachiella agariperforans]|uniref:Acyl-CoA reductase (LuxC) n=1 Tax=Reichenbachiella agariperforans TaxID=156994 RepID=A0A1M6KRT8_REIAG|nr:acyl-CoA reductase [Reichenbachiella agariperforans]SHJ61648.1 Acyl-CoA reductase (LuxC) [Reichenbachiella agariperforans]